MSCKLYNAYTQAWFSCDKQQRVPLLSRLQFTVHGHPYLEQRSTQYCPSSASYFQAKLLTSVDVERPEQLPTLRRCHLARMPLTMHPTHLISNSMYSLLENRSNPRIPDMDFPRPCLEP